MDKDVWAAYDELKKIKRAAPPKKAGRPPKYPWSTLEVGESFVVPAGKGSGHVYMTHPDEGIVAGRDRLEGLVTPEMAEAGLSTFERLSESYPDFLLVVEVYKAMWLAGQADHSPAKE